LRLALKFKGKRDTLSLTRKTRFKVEMQRPEALIAYVRQQNNRGDTRHPMRRLSSENP
jgi:hypothetical protein